MRTITTAEYGGYGDLEIALGSSRNLKIALSKTVSKLRLIFRSARTPPADLQIGVKDGLRTITTAEYGGYGDLEIALGSSRNRRLHSAKRSLSCA